MINLEDVKNYLEENNIDCWLIYNFRNRNPIANQIVGKNSATRRYFILVNQNASVEILAHLIDKEQFDKLNLKCIYYTSWQDLHLKLKTTLSNFNKIAMEYSPNCSIPNISIVDGGTIELINALNKTIVSSADIFQLVLAKWTNESIESQLKVSKEVEEIKNMAFDLISKSIKNKTAINEYDVQKFILDEFEKRNLETEDVPVVAANENSGNPHYEPSKDEYKLINEGDIILIDLWAKYKGDINVYSDITWMGYVGKNIPEKYTKIFDIVKGARDSVVNELEKLWQSGEKIYGWHLDQVARDYISKFGYGEYFIHRTGHSMAPGSELHAIGVNLDNFETRDDRLIRPGVGFSIEPGIYLDKFGVRSEINIYCDKEKGISITTNVQDNILKL